VARRISGFDPEQRAFATPEPLRAGSALRFALRDADFAREELSRALATTGPAAFGLHLLASDRGRALLGHAGLESAMVARAFAPAPVAALFGSFEIAPLAGRIEALAHASVLVACSDRK
jgi:small ligand-binding sensory domain FIST